MIQIKHSKYKNTGILFEILTRALTSDTLNGKSSPAFEILKKYFSKTELSKEYKLYEMMLNSRGRANNHINLILDTILNESKKLNKGNLKREKYNLVKEIKNHYNIDDLFKTPLSNYKVLSSLYTLLEINNTDKTVYPQQIVDNKLTLLENLSIETPSKKEIKDDVLEEFRKSDKDLRILTCRILLEKFNQKYNNLYPDQKRILKEYINCIDNSSNLKNFYNIEIKKVREQLNPLLENITEPATKIKLKEVFSLLKEICPKKKLKTESLVNLLQYYSLIEELKYVST